MCLSVLALVRQQEGHLARKKLNVSTLSMGDLTAVLHVLEFQCHHCHLHYHLQQPNLGPFDILVWLTQAVKERQPLNGHCLCILHPYPSSYCLRSLSLCLGHRNHTEMPTEHHFSTISVRFNGHFSRWTWVSRYRNVSVLDSLELRMMEMVVTTGAIISAKLQSNRHHQQTDTQLFCMPDALPVAQPTVSKHQEDPFMFYLWK